MKALDTLIEEYISADEDRRLSMFLSCRELRNRFIEIDLSESTFTAVSRPADVTGLQLNGWRRFCPQWLRPCCWVK